MPRQRKKATVQPICTVEKFINIFFNPRLTANHIRIYLAKSDHVLTIFLYYYQTA